MRKIVVIDSVFPDLEQERAIAAKHGAVVEEVRCNSAADVAQAARGADALLVTLAKVDSAVIEEMSAGACVIRCGLGLDNIDVRAARRRGIRVAYVPDYATGEVADHTVTLILTALRKIIALDTSVRRGTWDGVNVSAPLPGFADLTVGFVGFGRIARAVHARLQAFGFKSVFFDPAVDPATLVGLEAQSLDLETLFSQADVITLHTPLLPTTRHLVNATRLGLMKPTALLVNTARGGLVDTAALNEALLGARLGGAALDVFESEPLPADSQLRQHGNVILTPHIAWYSARSARRLRELSDDELERFLTGRSARCPAPEPS